MTYILRSIQKWEMPGGAERNAKAVERCGYEWPLPVVTAGD